MGRRELVGIDIMTGVTLRPVSIDPGCDQVEAAPDRHHMFVLNADNSLTAVDSMTGQLKQTIRTTGVIDVEGDSDFLIAPDGRTVYVANQFRGVTVIPVA